MDEIAVYCSWADEQLLSNEALCKSLPIDLVNLIRTSTGSKYIDALATAALTPTYCDKIFVLYEPLIIELTARWMRSSGSGTFTTDALKLSCLARILPFAPYLKPLVQALLGRDGSLAILSVSSQLKLIDVGDEQLMLLLLAFFRLLSYDVETFSSAISPVQLLSLLQHVHPPVRYLAIRCIGLYMHMADAATQAMIKRRINDVSLRGDWEGTVIDYELLSLWEEKRWKELEQDLGNARLKRNAPLSSGNSRLADVMLSPTVAEIGGSLIPRSGDKIPPAGSFVRTTTANRNLSGFARALLYDNPILLTGVAGSGKTFLVTEVARELNKLRDLVVLHLNQQTDAKSLLGLYTTSEGGGSFSWKPGVLTRAVTEGRWVLIEDIDRAPSDVLGVILPLIEKNELLIPSRKERIRAAVGFRIIATTQASKVKGDAAEVLTHSLPGARIWKRLHVDDLGENEIKTVLQVKFPLLHPYLSSILSVHHRLLHEHERNRDLKLSRTKIPALRDLLKWCRRIECRLKLFGVKTGFESVPDSVKDDLFLDAVSCYISHSNSDNLHIILTSCIAEELHISPQRAHHILFDRVPAFSENEKELNIGRAVISKVRVRTKSGAQMSNGQNFDFAMTRHALKTMETIAGSLQLAEPILLVGETGIGKTTLIQHLAYRAGQKLTVVNLSQQSESSDILGGFKPITTRSIALPLIEKFDDLFDATFSAKKNQKFQSSGQKCVARQNWPRLLLLWQEAVQMAENVLKLPVEHTSDGKTEQPAKRRKLATPKYEDLRRKWTDFAASLREFQSHNHRGNGKFAFAFVEGKIVQALKNGEWVLLDEINLASPDTLDSIADLLHHGTSSGPSVLLTEAGDMERIEGHPNFRILAAMNPATDAGKKDLAPGLRSRFTEIYVQPFDNDFADLLSLIKTYVSSLLDTDRRAASDLAELYMHVKKLNDENLLTDGAGQHPHFSVRSLVRCLIFVQQHSLSYGLRRAMHEGFAMSFLTMLSQDAERLVLPLMDRWIFSNVKNIRSLLNQPAKVPRDESTYISFKHHWVRRGSLAPELQPFYIITPFVERNLLNLARATSMHRFPILLQGPTSSGKTSMIEYLAKISGNRFVRINNHEHTDLQEYLGSYTSGDDGRLYFREGILVEALRNGYWIVLDELNLAPTDVLEALNRLLDDNRELFLPESQEMVHPHPGFMLFATQNPAGLYGGRKHLSRAFRNRFLELHFDDIPEDELEFILKERSQIAPSFCTRIVAVYKKLSILRQSSRLFEQRNSFATLRDLFRWALRRADDREQLALNGFMLLAERVRNPLERKAVKDVIEDVMKIKIDEKSFYGNSSLPASAQLPEGIVWTPAMRRLFVLVSNALENNEPVLLIGDTGCGKTQICQTVAQMCGRELKIYNAHTNTEIGDLIGAQRPIRHRAAIEAQLLEDLRMLVNQSGDEDTTQIGVPLSDLITYFQNLDISQMDAKLVQKIRRGVASARSLFEWVDGSLVSAMKNGEHFLLDEISLADDSVLERLNSVLEPSRTILLAEKGPIDSSVTGSPGFQFLATMNPGGDYGKRELSAALRNRLTEIWVPTLSESDDMLPILQAKIRLPLQNVAGVMVDFAKWFKTSFHDSASDSVSLRDLLAWVNFTQTLQNTDPYMAIVHGAAMVFIDAIGANPAGMFTVSSKDIQSAQLRCLDKLGELLQHDVGVIYNEIPRLHFREGKLRIGHFEVATNLASSSPSGLVFEAPTTRKNAMRILRGLQISKPILLEGNPGVGKTAIVSALAQAAGQPLTRINLSDQTDLMDLFGADVPSENEALGNFTWRDGPFLQAMQRGGWVLLDEMNLASQSVLEGLNSCLDHRKQVYIPELDKTFNRHPNFVLFAAQNPHHQGGGRKGLPASFVNRFTVVYADALKDEDLFIICQRQFPTIPQAELRLVLSCVSELNLHINSNHAFGASGAPWEFNLRDISRWLKLHVANFCRINVSQFFNMIVQQRFRTHAQKALTKAIHSQVFDVFSDASLFHNLSPYTYQIGLACLRRSGLSQYVSNTSYHVLPQDLPYAESLIHCINQNWPALLVGPSGCGKTILLRNLAAISGARLTEIALNGDTDTMDLIGGFEQLNSRRSASELLRGLCDELQDYFKQTNEVKSPVQNWDIALDLYHTCKDSRELDLEMLRAPLNALSSSNTKFSSYLKKLNSLILETNDQQMQFKWADGSLIEAMERGSWVVLDNANLCNPSVLDRLNSVLEPNGHLVVSEQHAPNGLPRTIIPHSNFRIFMTMDPRNGELSRAMRNRSVEIFMDQTPHHHLSSNALAYPWESKISHLRRLVSRVAEESEASPQLQITSITLDHIPISQLSSVLQQRDELQAIATRSSLQYEFSSYQLIPSALHEQTRRLYESMCSTVQWRSDLALYQPAFPLINEPLAMVSTSAGFTSQARRLAWLYEAFLLLSEISKSLSSLWEDFQARKSSEMTSLERSFKRQRSSANDRKMPIAAFLSIIEHILRDALHILLETVDETRWPTSTTDRVLLFVRELIELISAGGVQEGTFQVYLSVGRKDFDGLCFDLPVLDSGVAEAFKLIKANWSLRYGQSLRRMWKNWKPKTPSSLAQLDGIVELSSITEQFDSMTRRVSVPRPMLAEIRNKLLQTHSAILQDVTGVDALIQDLKRSIVTLNSSCQDSEFQAATYFKHEFESLCQIHDLDRIANKRSLLQEQQLQELLSLLADRATTGLDFSELGSPVPEMLSGIAHFAGWANRDAGEPFWKGNFLPRLLKRSELCLNQPLNTLDQMRDELELMTRTVALSTEEIAADSMPSLANMLYELIFEIIISHEDLFRPEVRSSFSRKLEVGTTRTATAFAQAGSELFHDQVPNDHYFRNITTSYLMPASVLLTSEAAASIQGMKLVGAALVMICMASLHLLVPDRPVDPALDLVVQRDRHTRRFKELQNKLLSLQYFEEEFTGRTSNFRMGLVRQSLAALGDEPPPPAVVRPSRSQIENLQGEFSNILRSVVVKAPEKVLLSGLEGPFRDTTVKQAQRLEEANQLRQNVLQIVQRFSGNYHGYADLSTPIKRILQCLSLGADLVILDREEHSAAKAAFIQSYSNYIPLIAGGPDALLDSSDSKTLSENGNLDTRFQALEHLIVSRTVAITELRDQAFEKNLLSLLDIFYQEWKKQLTEDQKLTLRRSTYYSYRDEMDSDEATLEADVEELFPSFSNAVSISETKTDPKSFDPRTFAVKLAALQAKLFGHANRDPDLRNYVYQASSSIASIIAENDFNICPVAPNALLPGTLLSLDLQLKQLQAPEQLGAVNIYTDPNLSEAEKLRLIAHNVRNRFMDIKSAWPDHSLPQDVIACCDEIFQFKLRDPIAKLLTKTEKLHAIVSEWQSIASREFSAASLSNEITALIVSWRRRELSSWRNLLDIEKKQCEEAAHGWYFLLYETLVFVPLQICEADGDMKTHAKTLTEVLQGFLKDTPIGQFPPRLRLLESFKSLLSILVDRRTLMKAILSAVSNVLRHYARYESSVGQSLEKGRAKFEKEIQDQIQLASWRDTNVTTLRDSAKRSHHKLFKTIRKYRASMAQPIDGLESQNPSGDKLGDISLTQCRGWKLPDESTKAFEVCQTALVDWYARPERLKAPLGAAHSMRQLYITLLGDFASHTELNSFTESLLGGMSDFRSQTPAKLTDENKGLVQYLKSQKRKLFADTLRSLRQMGVRRNLSAEELETQGSVSAVLATVPSADDVGLENFVPNAGDFFHAFLDRLPEMRGALREHSEDLTSSEVNRSAGLLEGLLLITRRQRVCLASASAQLHDLQDKVQQLANLQRHEQDALLAPSYQIFQGRRSLEKHLVWLPRILDLSCTILEIQANYGKLDFVKQIDSIRSYESKLLDLGQQLKDADVLPRGLWSKRTCDAVELATATMRDFNSELIEWSEEDPRVRYITQSLISWTTINDTVEKSQVNGIDHLSLETVDQTICAAADKIFVALQKMTRFTAIGPKSSEDPMWFTRTDTQSSSLINALRMSEISSSIFEALCQLRRVGNESLNAAASLLIVLTPIIEQFFFICCHVVDRYAALHQETCRMSFVLVRAFTALATDGFCSPSYSHGEENDQSGQVESGTGLGEGEGAEDISKDIADDEDLTELAQNQASGEKKEDVENSNDAVDMGQEELEGEMDDVGESKDDEGGDEDSAASENGDIDEETGSVDDLDPSAVDEKLWDGLQKEEEKELENDKGQGNAKEEQAAAQQNQDKPKPESSNDVAQEGSQDDEGSVQDEESEAVGQEDVNETDAHAQQEQALELPDEMQLDGDKNMDDEQISDDGLDKLSNIADAEPDRPPLDAEDDEEGQNNEVHTEEDVIDTDSKNGEDDGKDEEVPNENAEDQDMLEPDKTDEEDDGNYQTQQNHDIANADSNGQESSGAGNQPEGNPEESGQDPAAQARQASLPAPTESLTEPPAENEISGTTRRDQLSQKGENRDQLDVRQAEAFKKLGDMLEQWHRQRREILKPEEDSKDPTRDGDIDMADADLEHVRDEQEDGETQALGGATKDQARALDQDKAFEDSDSKQNQDEPMPGFDEENHPEKETVEEDMSNQVQSKPESEEAITNGVIVAGDSGSKYTDHPDAPEVTEEMQDVDHQLSSINLSSSAASALTSPEDAFRLWTHYSSITHHLSLLLTEQLRLILAPTLATKLRGDFRSGKRLNIKRIIPYIASQYKRDKIWMRRSVPSKRSYQIMLAVDDSKSMMEGGAGALAYETLALLCKSLSMLEVGEICVVGFGNEDQVRVAHPFGQPFTNEAGPLVFQNFSFQQTGTNVRKLVADSISLFQEARAKSMHTQADLWQLQLIISDGICEDHETIRRLVRKASEDRIMIVFVIVDSTAGSSIMDLTQASFEADDAGNSMGVGGGEMKLKMKRYLDGFPFPYYLIVRDVRDLPVVLATALKGWFAEVVDVQA